MTHAIPKPASSTGRPPILPLTFGRILLLLLLLGVRAASAQEQEDPPAELPATYEAENASRRGIEVRDQLSGFSGSGYVVGLNQVGNYIQFDIEVPRQDFYTLRFRFLNPGSEPAQRTLLLDGVEIPGVISFRNVYEVLGPDSGAGWTTLDESLRLDAGRHTVTLVFQPGDDGGELFLDSLQLLDETTPSVTSTRSLLMNNWTNLVGIHYSSALNPGFSYKLDQGPRLGSLHWQGNWPRSQIESAAAFFRDETADRSYTEINRFNSHLYFDDDGIMHVDYLNYGEEAVPVQIKKEYAMVPGQPVLLARYRLQNESSEDRAFSLMERVEVSRPGEGAQVEADWLPEYHAWIAATGQGAFLIFGAFGAPDSHRADMPSESGVDLLTRFEEAGVLESNDAFTSGDVDMAMTRSATIGSGQAQEWTFYYSVQPSRADAEAVAESVMAKESPEPWFEQTRSSWRDWLAEGRSTVDSGDPGIDRAYTRNLIVLRQSQQPEFGSFVASTNPIYFHKVWPRDATISALSLDAAGYFDQAEKFWRWMAEVQEEEPGNVEGTSVEDFPGGTW